MTDPTTNEQKPLPEPQSGGSYLRHEDGTLELVHCTAPAEPRDKRQADPDAAEAADAMPVRMSAQPNE